MGDRSGSLSPGGPSRIRAALRFCCMEFLLPGSAAFRRDYNPTLLPTN